MSKGLEFEARGETLRAQQYLAVALESGGDVNLILPHLMRICIRAERYAAAAQYGEDYLTRAARRDDLELLLASIYVALEQSPAAHSHLSAVVARRPNEPFPHLLLARLLRDELRDSVGADRHFRAYLALAPNGEAVAEAQASLLQPVQPQVNNE